MPAQTTYEIRGKREIVFERAYDAPPERVFAALTDPNLVARWWGSAGATLVVEAMDPRPGGTWRFVETDAKGKRSTFHGEYLEIEPPARIVSTLRYGAGLASKLFPTIHETYELLPHGRGTLLRVTSKYPMGAALKGMLSVGMDDPGGRMDGSRHQWRLDRLAALVKE